MTTSRVAIVLTPEAELLMKPILDIFMTKPLSRETKKPICLVCESVDFSTPLVEAHALTLAGKKSFRLWIPHQYVSFAFDYSPTKQMGFLLKAAQSSSVKHP